MLEQHAPGPWRWRRTYQMSNRRRHWSLYNDESEAEGKTIDASLVLLLSEEKFCERPFLENPNARLIAAAPDLLEALEFALQQTGCDGDLCTEDWHEEARKAIAKARGG